MYFFYLLINLFICSFCYFFFLVVTETSSSRHRQWMGIAFNAGYPVGTALLAGLAYLAPDWRHLQFIISVPALILVFHAWYVSPDNHRARIRLAQLKIIAINVQVHAGIAEMADNPESSTRR